MINGRSKILKRGVLSNNKKHTEESDSRDTTDQLKDHFPAASEIFLPIHYVFRDWNPGFPPVPHPIDETSSGTPGRALHRASLRFQTKAKQFGFSFLPIFFGQKKLARTGIRASRRFARCIAPHFDSRRKPSSWLSFLPIFFGQKKLARTENPGFPPVRALHRASLRFQTKAKQLAFFLANFFWTKKIGQNWNPGFPPVRALHRASLRFPTKAKQLAFFLANFFWTKKLARTGIEPATQGFSVLCSTD